MYVVITLTLLLAVAALFIALVKREWLWLAVALLAIVELIERIPVK